MRRRALRWLWDQAAAGQTGSVQDAVDQRDSRAKVSSVERHSTAAATCACGAPTPPFLVDAQEAMRFLSLRKDKFWALVHRAHDPIPAFHERDSDFYRFSPEALREWMLRNSS